VIKLFEFIQRAPNLHRDEFRRAWQEHGARRAGRGVGRYVQNHAIPDALIPELTLSDLDCADELWLDGLDAVAEALEEAPPDLVDVERTIRLVAEEAVQFDRGFGEVKFIGLSVRHPRMSHDEWIRYWVDVHGPLAHGVPEFTRYYGRYVHNYVLPSDVGTGGRTPEYDGIVEEWLESAEAMASCLAEPKYLEIVRPDELEFVDFSRSHMMLTEECVIQV
jgi:EthD domain